MIWRRRRDEDLLARTSATGVKRPTTAAGAKWPATARAALDGEQDAITAAAELDRSPQGLRRTAQAKKNCPRSPTAAATEMQATA
ncbi:hypothetical protein V6N12_044982 [Hibiscus sabdariffa]|uniref:Uncharacterized protein n=1 Tax=Hibiscus sabdariffa TaxID=183260 RepID=A0ABR2G1G7_9ROSI